jgi:hypothetical protein
MAVAVAQARAAMASEVVLPNAPRKDAVLATDTHEQLRNWCSAQSSAYQTVGRIKGH